MYARLEGRSSCSRAPIWKTAARRSEPTIHAIAVGSLGVHAHTCFLTAPHDCVVDMTSRLRVRVYSHRIAVRAPTFFDDFLPFTAQKIRP